MLLDKKWFIGQLQHPYMSGWGIQDLIGAVNCGGQGLQTLEYCPGIHNVQRREGQGENGRGNTLGVVSGKSGKIQRAKRKTFKHRRNKKCESENEWEGV